MDDIKGRWVGKFPNGEIVVFDPETQDVLRPDRIALWSLTSRRPKEYSRELARQKIRAAESDTWLHAIREYERPETPAAKQAIDNHNSMLERFRLPYAGVRIAGPRNRRVTHCWACKRDLDSEIDFECIACGWILCKCGACGCPYNGRG
jgi:hypothetical protein